ncbi:hypothetical protein GOC91_23475 [Sinorhizobium medicae]|nr:hypothetical protein [Sinorhizobium medicae]MBO1944052.1 hypothetical protein [Sinorhizobium medicae]MBO1965059.1 hypothetical protein [Sinorhizobium medicae]MDX0406529.1 hypothetical protein [Sinorhizobium medicae]MDX0413080.1 hypothetical protein [Sinorhizobium medicae]MDX0418881.1 hypothetical protein [Sinorhizobium medicae]
MKDRACHSSVSTMSPSSMKRSMVLSKLLFSIQGALPAAAELEVHPVPGVPLSIANVSVDIAFSLSVGLFPSLQLDYRAWLMFNQTKWKNVIIQFF